MNKLPLWKQKLIQWLAGKEPVIINFCILSKNLPDKMKAVIVIPADSEKRPVELYEDVAFLVPMKNIAPHDA